MNSPTTDRGTLLHDLVDRQQISDVMLAVTTPAIWARFASACLQRMVVVTQYSNFHINLRGDTTASRT